MTQPRRSRGRTRRAFLSGVSGTIAAGAASPALARRQRAGGAGGAGRAALEGCEAIVAVDLPGAEEDLALPLVNANREHVEALRRVAVGPGVEPAFSFHPPRPAAKAAPVRRPAAPAPRRPAASRLVTDDELPFLPASALGEMVRTRKITSTELTQIYLARLEEIGPRLECVITLTPDLALEQAAAADRAVRAGRVAGPLHGVPWGVKDLFATRGIPTTWGAKPFADQVFDFDATVVERLARAGAVLVAKLTSGELAIGDVWFGGRTRNPWNPLRGSGGSSAGPASAASAGLVGFAVGTETGGSIMQPASLCGVVGLRPTYGRISRHGAMTLRWTMDKVGPICRRVEDCVLVFEALRGPDGRDETVVDAPFAFDANASLEGLRVGFVEREFAAPPEDADAERRAEWAEARGVQDAALDVFRAGGAAIEPVALPDLPARSVYALLNAEAGAMFDDLVRSGRHNELAGKGPNDRANQLRAIRFVSAVDYIRAQRVRTLLIREMNRLFERVDVFLAPPDSASVAMTNLTGHPAMTVPSGFVSGLPQGVMVTGRLYDEATVLRAALAFERATGWHTKHPEL